MTEGTNLAVSQEHKEKKKPKTWSCGVFRLFIVEVAAICYKRKSGCIPELCAFLHSSDTAQKEVNILSSIRRSDFSCNTLCSLISAIISSIFLWPLQVKISTCNISRSASTKRLWILCGFKIPICSVSLFNLLVFCQWWKSAQVRWQIKEIETSGSKYLV